MFAQGVSDQQKTVIGKGPTLFIKIGQTYAIEAKSNCGCRAMFRKECPGHALEQPLESGLLFFVRKVRTRVGVTGNHLAGRSFLIFEKGPALRRYVVQPQESYNPPSTGGYLGPNYFLFGCSGTHASKSRLPPDVLPVVFRFAGQCLLSACAQL